MPATQTTAEYGDLSFDTRKWNLVENGETLGFVPNIASLATQGHLKIGPIQPAPPPSGGFFGNTNMRALVEQFWARLAAGQLEKGSRYISEFVPLNFGGNRANANVYYHEGHFASGACGGVMLIEANGKVTPFEMKLDTERACVLMDTFDFIMETLKVRPGTAPKPTPALPPINIGAPSDQGADPYESIDWDGPDDWAYGTYDIHPVNVKRELKALALLDPNFIGSVAPKTVTFDQVIASLRTMANDPKTKDDYATFKKMASTDLFANEGTAFAGALSGEPVMALLQIFGAYEVDPNDANNWLNIAALLAHFGLANESMAVIKEMERTGKRPDPPVINAQAAIEYLKGYNQLLLGQTLTAKGHLHQAMTLDPFLKEAAVALALAQKLTGEEEAAEQTYTIGVWRRRPSQIVYCGGTGGKKSPDGPDIRPPITDMLDVSHGTPGVLWPFEHPHTWAEALELKDTRLHPELIARQTRESQALAEQVEAMSKRLAARPKTATEAWYGDLEFLMQTLEVDEPPVAKLAENMRRADKELKEAVEKIGKRSGPIFVQISMQPGDHHDELAALATQNVLALRPYAQAFDTALRRLFRVERRYETGLVAQMGDPEWHQKETLALQLEFNAFWATFKGRIAGSYILVASFVPPPSGSPNYDGSKKDDIQECPENMRNLGMKYNFKLSDLEPKGIKFGPDVSFGIKVTCDKVGFETAYYPWQVKGGLVEFQGGVFGQTEVKPRTGDLTVFVGEVGKANLGIGGVGVGGSVKAGAYMEANVKTGQVKAIGVKAAGETVAKFGDQIQLGSKAFESKPSDLRIEFLPSVETPARGPNLADTRRAPSP